MKVGGGAAKGSEFERRMMKQFSLWWSGGTRDDVFWRTAGSGARATARGRRALRTAGHYGDLTATDELGQPFVNRAVVEFKTGYGREPWDVLTLLELDDKIGTHQLTRFWEQACAEAVAAGDGRTPLLVFRRMRSLSPLMMMRFEIAYKVCDSAAWGHALVWRTHHAPFAPAVVLLPLAMFFLHSDPAQWARSV